MRQEEDIDWDEFVAEISNNLQRGDKVTGIVVGVESTTMQVDIGTGCTAYIPYDPDVYVGDEIEAYVMYVDTHDMTIKLSWTPPYAPEPDMDELRDSLYEEILSEVRDGLSQMKPEVISSITEQAVRRLNSYYSSRIEQLEKRISQLENLIDRTGVITK